MIYILYHKHVLATLWQKNVVLFLSCSS